MRRLGEEMPSGCWIAVLLLLLPAVTEAQSGDGDADVDSRISCTSDIMTDGSSLTCKLVEGRNDNEDDEDYQADGIENMTACFTDFSTTGRKCVNNFGDTVSSRDLSLVVDLNVTIHLKRGGQISKRIDLKKIGKLSSFAFTSRCFLTSEVGYTQNSINHSNTGQKPDAKPKPTRHHQHENTKISPCVMNRKDESSRSH